MSRLLFATIFIATTTFAADLPTSVTARIAQYDTQWKAGDFAGAERNYKALVVECASKPCFDAEIALLNNNYGTMLVFQGRYAEARPLLATAVKAFAASGKSRDAQRGTSLLNYGEASRQMTDNQEAEKALLEAAALRAQAHGAQSREVAAVYVSLASLYRDTGRFNEAAEITEKGLSFFESGKIPEDLIQSTLLDLRGLHLRQKMEFTRAEQAYRKSLEIRNRIGTPHPTLIASSHNNLGAVYMDQLQYQAARTELEEAVRIRSAAQGPDHPLLVPVYSNLAVCLQELGESASAEHYAAKAVEIATAKLGPNHAMTASAANNLGEVYVRTGRLEQADPLLRKSVEVLERTAPNSPTLAVCLANLAQLFVMQEKHAGAEKLLVRALKIFEQVHSPEDPAYRRLGKVLAQVYRLQHRNTEADRFERNSFRFAK